MDSAKPFRVCLLGATLGTWNRGVSALTASLVELISDVRPEARFCLLIGDDSPGWQYLSVKGKQVAIEVVNYRLSLRSRPSEQLAWIFAGALVYRLLRATPMARLVAERSPWLRAVVRADFIGDIRGGDSFSDIYGMKRYFFGSLARLVPIIMQKPLVLLPQTYGPFRSWRSRALARMIVRGSNQVLSRDLTGAAVLQSLMGPRHSGLRVRYCPDVAFALPAITPRNPTYTPSAPRVGVPIIGLNVNGLMYNGGYCGRNSFGLSMDYREFLRMLVGRLADSTEAQILLVPHVFAPTGDPNSDPEACARVYHSLSEAHGDRLIVLEGDYDQNEIKGLIGTCEFFVGSRMHSCIAALSQGVSAVGVAYSRKFAGVFSAVGMGDMVIDARSCHESYAVDRVLSLYSVRSEVVPRLSRNVARLQAEVRETFFRLLGNLER